MIIAKAENMELVVFIKNTQNSGKWWALTSDVNMIPPFDDDLYFVCLPKHKEACLHWLNGGKTQVLDRNWVNLFPIESYPWELEHDFMCDENEIRITPKKEKRWIGVYGAHVTDGHYPNVESCKRMTERSDKFKHCAPEKWQFIEIEIEV